MHLSVFLHELLAVDLVFGLITCGDEFLASGQDANQDLFITTLGGEEKSITGCFGRWKSVL